MRPMITKNPDGTYTVANILTCLSEEAALALLEETGVHALVHPLTIKANEAPRVTYGARIVEDEISGMPRAEIFKVVAA